MKIFSSRLFIELDIWHIATFPAITWKLLGIIRKNCTQADHFYSMLAADTARSAPPAHMTLRGQIYACNFKYGF